MCSPSVNPVQTADVDIFSPDMARLDALEARLLDMGYTRHPSLHTEMAKTLVQPSLPSPLSHVQLVLPRHTAHMDTSVANVEQLLSKLDFTVARAAVVSPTLALVDEDFAEDERHRRLRIRHIVCPISSVRRMVKYGSKGYRARMLEITKLFAEWSTRASSRRLQSLRAEARDSVQGARAAAEITPTTLLELMSKGTSDAGDIEGLMAGLYVD